MSHFRKNGGQTIIEAVVALSCILLALAAISVAIVTSINNSEFSKNQTLAAKYAQQGMESMTYLRSTDPVAFESRSGVYCMYPDSTTMCGDGTFNQLCAGTCTNVNIASTFKREAEFVQNSTDCGVLPTTAPTSSLIYGTKVTVSVYWASGKCNVLTNSFCHKSQLVSCFSRTSSYGTQL